MALFMFTTKEAIAISGFTILMGSIARFITGTNARHPEKDAVIIDYGIVIVMMPLVLCGSFVGVLANFAMPPLLLCIMLTATLLGLTYQSWGKAWQIHRKEDRERQTEEVKEIALSAMRPPLHRGIVRNSNRLSKCSDSTIGKNEPYKQFDDENSETGNKNYNSNPLTPHVQEWRNEYYSDRNLASVKSRPNAFDSRKVNRHEFYNSTIALSNQNGST